MLFCPSKDCENIPTSYFQAARKSIDCALYDLKLWSWIGNLTARSNDIPVRLIVEARNKHSEHPSYTIYDKNNALMHHKFCIIDKQIVITGSMNPTENGVSKNNNNVLILKSKIAAMLFELEFEEMNAGEYGRGKSSASTLKRSNATWQFFFCPEDNCREQVIEKIEAATYVDGLFFSFTDDQISYRLALLGNKSRIIQEKKQSRQKYSKMAMLRHFGVQFREDNNKATMHHKVFIMDNSSVFFGSYNPTDAGTKKNDEVLIWTNNSDIVNNFIREFEKLWNEADL